MFFDIIHRRNPVEQSKAKALKAYRDICDKKSLVKDQFRLFDKDRDSKLSRDEFGGFLRGCSILLNDQDFDYFFRLSEDQGSVNYEQLCNMAIKYSQADSSSFVIEDENIQNSRVIFDNTTDESRMMLRISEIPTQSNPYMNPYNHTRPQNISRIDGSMIEDEHQFAPSIFRTGHYIHNQQRKLDQSDEMSTLTSDLLNYDIRPNVTFIHKNIIVSSTLSIHEDTIHSIIANLQQELMSFASLRHSFLYPITDTSTEKKCVLSMIWQGNPSTSNANSSLESIFGIVSWKRLCEKYTRMYNLNIEWMIDVNPNNFSDKLSVYR